MGRSHLPRAASNGRNHPGCRRRPPRPIPVPWMRPAKGAGEDRWYGSKILGQQVAVPRQCRHLTPPAMPGGGTVLIGGNFHGAGPEQKRAEHHGRPTPAIKAQRHHERQRRQGSRCVVERHHPASPGAISARGGANRRQTAARWETSGHNLNILSGATVNALGALWASPAAGCSIRRTSSSIRRAVPAHNETFASDNFSQTLDHHGHHPLIRRCRLPI